MDDRDYRRGYIHGYMSALDDIESGTCPKDMNDFFNEYLLHGWYEEKRDQYIEPPKLTRI